MTSLIKDFRIEAHTYGGNSIGTLEDGRKAFVPFALPGELVRAQITEEKSHWVRARLLEVLEPSPARIKPRCKHFGDCGGCHYQHMEYADQLVLKRQLVVEQLQRVAGIPNPPVEPGIPSPESWNQRNSLQFHLSSKGKLGFQASASHRVVEISECWLPVAELDAVWRQMEFEAGTSIERVQLRAGTKNDVLMILEGSPDNLPELDIESPISIVHLTNEGALVLAGNGGITMEIQEQEFVVSAGSFFQVNTGLANRMVTEVLEQLSPSTDSTVMDAYCGVGLFSAFLAPRVAQVIGIESSESACRDYAENLDSFENVSLYQATAEQVFPSLESPITHAVVDPPRAGMAPEVLQELVRLAPQKLVYVSCDPATLARDAKKLVEAGYTFERCLPMDMFPQTYHIETISTFCR